MHSPGDPAFTVGIIVAIKGRIKKIIKYFFIVASLSYFFQITG